MSNQINHNPANDPGFPISPDMIEDTEGHRRMMIEEAEAVRSPRIEDDEDAEGHRMLRIEDADDTEGHVRLR